MKSHHFDNVLARLGKVESRELVELSLELARTQRQVNKAWSKTKLLLIQYSSLISEIPPNDMTSRRTKKLVSLELARQALARQRLAKKLALNKATTFP